MLLTFDWMILTMFVHVCIIRNNESKKHLGQTFSNMLGYCQTINITTM
jgi:hypothetical protein